MKKPDRGSSCRKAIGQRKISDGGGKKKGANPELTLFQNSEASSLPEAILLLAERSSK